MKTTHKVAIWVLGGLMFCCAGFLGIGLIVGPPDTKPKSTFESSTPEPARGVADLSTAVPVQPAVTTAPTTSAPRAEATTVAPPKKPATKPTTSKPIVEPKPKPKPTTKAPSSVYYKNCAAVRAAGAAPIHRGDPGYAKHLDRDGDGVGCES